MDLIDGGDIVSGVIGGWRFLFSRSYRIRKRKEWHGDHLSAFFEIALGLFGILLSLSAIALGAYLLLEALSSEP